MTVMWALEADTVEYGEYLTGVRIEGLTYSLFSFTRKCGQAIGGSIPAFILGLSGYIANQVQTPEVIMGIRTSIALVFADLCYWHSLLSGFIRSRIKNSKKSWLKLIIVKKCSSN